MKKIITFLAALILFVSCTSVKIMAAQETDNGYQYVINDLANLLTDEEEDELYYYIEPLLEYGNVIFQSVDLSSGTSYEKYSEDTYYEYFGNEPGVIFQIDMGHRQLTLSSSTALDDEISSERDSIVDNVYRYASDEDYLRCASRCFDEVYTVLNDGKIAHNMKYIDNALLAIIISLIVNFMIAFSGNKRKATTGEIAAAMTVSAAAAAVAAKKGKIEKIYDPVSSGSGSSGGSSGGGGGGGGFSGGSSSHGF